MTPQQRTALIGIANAIVETCREVGPNGAPAGSLYAACMSHGISYDAFAQIMDALVKVGKLRKGALPHHYVAVK